MILYIGEPTKETEQSLKFRWSVSSDELGDFQCGYEEDWTVAWHRINEATFKILSRKAN